MDSPESSTKPALAQDSPVFSYISNLSPIQTVRALAVSQGFSGLNSPPLVFTSPQLTPHNQSALLRRERFLGRSTIELFRHEAGCKNRATANNGSEKLDSPLSTRLINHACEGSDSKSLVKDQIESPIDCSDQFLTDVINMDSVDPNVSCDRTVKVLEYVDQLLETTEGSKEFAVNTDNNLESRIKEEIAVDPPTIITDIEDVNAKDIPVDVTVVSRDVKLGDSISTDQLQEIEPELPISNSLTIQDKKDSTSENVEIGESGRVDQPTALLSGAILIDDEKENTVDDAGAVLTETVLMEEQRSYEVLQFRGTRRRCLQFENAQHKEMPYCPAQNPSDSEVPKRQFLETPRTSVEGKQADKIQPVSHCINNLKLTTTIPKPSGMLHLNSIAKVVQTESGGTCNLKSAQMGNIRICGKKFIPVSNCHLSDNIKNSSVISATENVSASIDDKMHGSHSSEAANSAASLSAKPSNDFVILNQVEATPEYKRRCNTENDSGSNGLSISKKKRKVSSDSTDGDGCRRCNCKKSRCLKLYCDCFAAGIYCVDPCTCQGCLNRPEYEDTVLDTRQQIESRNPLAFAPKVVQPIIERPLKSSGEDQTHFTPASARHKRGCNCKKSMCLKKYCECYQGNVGCSDGCRCEGCQNIFGKKGEYRITENVLGEKYSSGRKDVSSVENFEIPASENGVYSMGLPNAHSLTPVTPEFDFSNHRKDASKDWFPSGRCLQSPESGPQFIAPYAMFPEPPTNSDGNDKTSENANENLDLISFDHEIDHGDAETVENFAALRQQPWNVGPLCSMSNLQEWASIPDAHCLSGSRQYSTLSSFQWRGSPNTPVVQFSGTKHLQVAGFDSELSNIMQDDTPELLKDSPTPPNAVKVSSPNKKRVSPPFGRPKFGPISAASVPTVRKFILRGVPSFPPLTPCTDSKTAVQQTSDHQNFRDNKLPES